MTAKARLMFLLASFDNFLKNRETVFARFGDSVALSVASPSGTLSFRVIPLTTLCRVAGQNCGLISIEKMVDWLLKEALNRKYLQYYFINLVDLHGLDLEWAFRCVWSNNIESGGSDRSFCICDQIGHLSRIIAKSI
jgi:hypothetical protein